MDFTSDFRRSFTDGRLAVTFFPAFHVRPLRRGALQAELAAIRQRQYLIIALVVLPYLYSAYVLAQEHYPDSVVFVAVVGLVVLYVVTTITHRRDCTVDAE